MSGVRCSRIAFTLILLGGTHLMSRLARFCSRGASAQFLDHTQAVLERSNPLVVTRSSASFLFISALVFDLELEKSLVRMSPMIERYSWTCCWPVEARISESRAAAGGVTNAYQVYRAE